MYKIYFIQDRVPSHHTRDENDYYTYILQYNENTYNVYAINIKHSDKNIILFRAYLRHLVFFINKTTELAYKNRTDVMHKNDCQH